MDAILYPQESHFKDDSFPLMSYHYRQRLKENHYHDFYELVVVLDGSGWHIADNRKYPIFRGDVFVIKPFTEHCYENAKDLQIENILFIPEALGLPSVDVRSIPGYFALFDAEPMLREKHDFRSRLTLNNDQLLTVTRIILNLRLELDKQQEGFRFLAIAHFMHLIGYLSRCYSCLKSKDSQKLLKISAMTDFIMINFAADITLADIADKGRISIRTANRLFKEALEESPIDYLIKVRINNARKLLENHVCNVAEAAFRSGFKDSNYFSKQFKRVVGVSPSCYKRKFNQTATRL